MPASVLIFWLLGSRTLICKTSQDSECPLRFSTFFYKDGFPIPFWISWKCLRNWLNDGKWEKWNDWYTEPSIRESWVCAASDNSIPWKWFIDSMAESDLMIVGISNIHQAIWCMENTQRMLQLRLWTHSILITKLEKYHHNSVRFPYKISWPRKLPLVHGRYIRASPTITLILLSQESAF